MTVKIIKTGEIADVSRVYGARLIEQGVAVLHAKETEAEEKPKKGRKAKADGAA